MSLNIKEADIKKQIKDYLNYFPDIFYFSLIGGLGCHRGQPDMIIIKKGVVLFIEIKTNKGQQSNAQIEFESKIKYVGGKYYVIRSVEDLQNILEKI